MTKYKIALSFILSFLFFVSLQAATREEVDASKPVSAAHTVVCVLEAAEWKIEDLKAALLEVAAHSRKEATNLSYRIHQSVDNPAQFILYETWKSAAEHKLQFEKTYIKEFMQKAEILFGKPYQGFFATELI